MSEDRNNCAPFYIYKIENYFKRKTLYMQNSPQDILVGSAPCPVNFCLNFQAELTLHKLSQPEQSSSRWVLHYLSDTALLSSFRNGHANQLLVLRSLSPVSRKHCTDRELIPLALGRFTQIWNVNHCSSEHSINFCPENGPASCMKLFKCSWY